MDFMFSFVESKASKVSIKGQITATKDGKKRSQEFNISESNIMMCADFTKTIFKLLKNGHAVEVTGTK